MTRFAHCWQKTEFIIYRDRSWFFLRHLSSAKRHNLCILCHIVQDVKLHGQHFILVSSPHTAADTKDRQRDMQEEDTIISCTLPH